MTTRIKKIPGHRPTSRPPCQAATTLRPEEGKPGRPTDDKPELKAEIYVPTPREETAIGKHRAHMAGDSPALRVYMTTTGYHSTIHTKASQRCY